MTNVAGGAALVAPGLLDRQATVAKPGFNRWYVPPAALAIHLCIGMAYGFSVFWLPMSKMLPNADAAACANFGFFDMLFTRSCNWTVPMVTPTFEMFIAMLGVFLLLQAAFGRHPKLFVNTRAGVRVGRNGLAEVP